MFVTGLLIIGALLVLSILVLVHEFGHMMAAKSIGVWVEEFGIGLPPKVWGKKIGETEYTINALPLGGFVRLHGETPQTKVTKPNRAFKNKSKLARAYVAVAGIFMSLLFAVFCLTAIFWMFGFERVRVVEVADNSPALEAGIQQGDIIKRVDGKEVLLATDFPAIVQDFKGETVDFYFERDGQEMSLPLTVNNEFVEDKGFTGILFESTGFTHASLLQRPFVYTYYGVKETAYWTEKTVEGFMILFSQLGRGEKPAGVAGPLGVTLTISEILRYGVFSAFRFTAIISVNLAVINLVPFPPLDGSRVALLGVEAIVGRKKVSKVEHRILEVGMAILLFLILVLTLTEIPTLIKAGSVSGFVDQLFGAAN